MASNGGSARQRAFGVRFAEEPEPQYRLWVNEERTVLMRLWSDGRAEVATREASYYTWGPPIYLNEEPV